MQRRDFLAGLLGATAVAGGELLRGGLALADEGDDRPGDETPLFDFSDRFYRANGLDPKLLVGRVTGWDGRSVFAATADPDHRNVRVVATNGGFDHEGGLVFFAVLANVNPTTFLASPAGQDANSVAGEFRAFNFPRARGSGRRQDDVFDMRHGLVGRNPLAIWTKASVRYTTSALSTTAGRQALAAMASRNGPDLDTTPLICAIDDIESLESRGFVTVTTLPTSGSAGPPWFLCPIIRDPVGRSLAPDATLAVTLRRDGTALVPQFHQLFRQLQSPAGGAPGLTPVSGRAG
jgi:hypothetical protein